jgi:hypothetical protein
MISRDNILIRFIGLFFLRRAMKGTSNTVGGELFFNGEFLGLLNSQMVSEQNLVMKNMLVDCVCEVFRSSRELTWKILVE